MEPTTRRTRRENRPRPIVRMFMRFKIKVHRKLALSDSARNFNRAALKSDENRDLLNQAYISARDEYDQQSPALPQSNAPRETTSVSHRQQISENQTLEYPDASPGTKRHTSSTPERHPIRPQKSPQTSQQNAPREATSAIYRQSISENQISEYPDAGPGTKRHTSSTPERHPNRPQRSPQSSFSPDTGPTPTSKTRVSGRQKILISGYPGGGPETKRHTSGTPERHPNRRYSHPSGPTPPIFGPHSSTTLCARGKI